GAINIQDGGKFETWLGSVVGPEEKFYLVAASEKDLNNVIMKSAKIGYELNIKGALTQASFREVKDDLLDVEAFTQNTADYTIVDVRDAGELKEGRLFANSIHIPLHELRE